MTLRKRLLYAALPTLLLLGAAEAAVRLSGAAETCPTYSKSWLWACDPILYFKTRQGAAGDSNAQGFRGHDLGPKKPGTFRILALGDSCTFGLTASDDGDGRIAPEPYPQLLERLAAERDGDSRIEVLNAGVPGYNSYQGVMLLRTKLRGLQPDLITARFGWNDHLMSPESRVGNAFREPANPWALAFEDLLLRTKLYPFSRRLGMELKLRFAVGAVDASPPPREWKPNVPLADYKRHLRRIVELGHAQGAAVWLLTAPDAFLTPELLARYEALPPDAEARVFLYLHRLPSFDRIMQIHDSYNDATRAVAAELDVPLIDMAELYRGHPHRPLFSILDVVHPTREGHRLEAEEIYARLAAEGLVTPAGGR